MCIEIRALNTMAVKFARIDQATGLEVWKMDWRPDGRNGTRRKQTFTGSREEAEYLYEQLKTNSGLEANKVTVNPKLSAIIDEYKRWMVNNRTTGTHDDFCNSWKFLKQYFGNLPASNITPQLIERYKHWRGLDKKRALEKDLIYLNRLINWMAEPARNYCHPLRFKIEKPKYRRPVPNPPGPDDVAALLSKINDPMKQAMILMMYQAGTRWNEVSKIKWENINWNRSAATIRGKGNKSRMVPLPDEVRAIIEPHKKPTGFVFLNPRTGNPYGSLKKLFIGASARADINRITAHKLRHACATDTLAASGDLRLVQVLLGHSSIETTTIYTQIMNDRLTEGYEKMMKYRERCGTVAPEVKQEKERNNKKK